MKKAAGFILLILVLAVLAWFFRPRDSLWSAVSGEFTADALRAFDEHTETVAVPFCDYLDSKGIVTPNPQCATWKQRFPQSEFCGIQNFSDGNWDPKVIQTDPKIIAALIEQVLLSEGCKTLVLDIESLRAKDRELFTAWATELTRSLRAREPDLRLVLPVHAKTEAMGSWDGAIAQDWKQLCPLFDEVIIMAYDYSFPHVTAPGETAPIAWVKQVLDFTKTVCPFEKVRLGLAAYGYNWQSGQPITEYRAASSDLFIETGKMREEKIALAHQYGIHRFFLWALGMQK